MDRALDTTVRLTDDCLALREQLRVQEAALKALRQVEREQLRAQAALEHSKRDRTRDLAHTNERRELAGRRLEQLQAQMDERWASRLLLLSSKRYLYEHMCCMNLHSLIHTFQYSTLLFKFGVCREQSGRRRADEIREYRKRLKRAMKSQATKTHESEKRKLLDLIADSRSRMC